MDCGASVSVTPGCHPWTFETAKVRSPLTGLVHYRKENWLLLMEASTSHGPVNIKCHNELKGLFAKSAVGLVFVTAFPSRKEMNRYLAEIAWESLSPRAAPPSRLGTAGACTEATPA